MYVAVLAPEGTSPALRFSVHSTLPGPAQSRSRHEGAKYRLKFIRYDKSAKN
jgi:hypothetical protein